MNRQTPPGEAIAGPPVVLLVEDDDSNREMYSLYLESSGLGVLGARNGEEGLIRAREHQPHVVVTDVSMPVMDGWELAQALRENDGTAQIAIIALSGRPREESALPLERRYVDVVLEKPCLPDDLLRAITRVLAHQRLAHLPAAKPIATAYRLRGNSGEPLEARKQHDQRRRK
jgi:CheY-like chemotaxis protein